MLDQCCEEGSRFGEASLAMVHHSAAAYDTLAASGVEPVVDAADHAFPAPFAGAGAFFNPRCPDGALGHLPSFLWPPDGLGHALLGESGTLRSRLSQCPQWVESCH